MPPFADAYSDEEITAVSNYVIGHFGGCQSKVTAAEVRRLRVNARHERPVLGRSHGVLSMLARRASSPRNSRVVSDLHRRAFSFVFGNPPQGRQPKIGKRGNGYPQREVVAPGA
jgi:hypothetical protein